MIITRWTDCEHPQGAREITCWDDVRTSILSRPVQAPKKSALPGWAPVAFRGDYRNKQNITAVYAVGIDIDGGATLAEVTAAFSSLWGYIHSTPSSTPDAPRFRVLLPLAAPMSDVHAAELVTLAMHRRAPGLVDRGAKDASRLWYPPWAGSAHFAHAGLDGVALDGHAVAAAERRREESLRVGAALERAVKRRQYGPPSAAVLTTYVERALARACMEIETASEGARHDTLTREAFSIGTLVATGVLARHVAHAALDAASSRVFPANREKERVRTLEQQLSFGEKHPRALP